MKIYSLEDTIAAISTPLGEGGIGIVRISGPQALRIADRLFRGKVKPSRASTYTLHYGHIVYQGEVIDEVILSVMRAPRSYTREDVVEINCHGGILPLRKTLEAVLQEGARLAKPGEFTLRAFLNGRIDLTQAEAVLDIVKAKSELSLRNAVSQLEGGLSSYLNRLEERLLHILSLLEANLDFPEEEVEPLDRESILKELARIKKELRRILEREKEGRILREGIQVGIVGRPNVGKSTLLNRMLGRERAIVTEIPGTTRDLIEEWINIQGVAFRLIDTAGWREVEDRVEKEGVRRTGEVIENADLLLVMIDGSEKITPEDERIMEATREKNRILVINKMDLGEVIDEDTLPSPRIKISALKGEGLEELKKMMVRKVLEGEIDTGEGILVTSIRQIELLRLAYRRIEEGERGFREGMSEEFLAQDLREALSAIKEIKGEEVGEEILEMIFSRFCIGK